MPLTKQSTSFRQRSVPTLQMVAGSPYGEDLVVVDGADNITEEAYDDSETRWFADLSTAPSLSLQVDREGTAPVSRISSYPSERGSIRSIAMSSGRGFDELAKEADGDPVSTEESSVATPRGPSSPRGSMRRSGSVDRMPSMPSIASSRASTVSQLDELAAVSAMARRELKAMETTISRYDQPPPAP